ncbi:hypothetical protein [Variovorax sp. RCC_210]|uniref:hypothetical protein n=1 Tax=Variovorax sp. RCC_210 TaxID=3239217 RepID=UPI00352399B3
MQQMKTAPLGAVFLCPVVRRKLWHFQDQLAEKIAAGNFGSLSESFPALVHGFGGVMLYGGVGVRVLADISGLIVGRDKPSVQQEQGSRLRA